MQGIQLYHSLHEHADTIVATATGSVTATGLYVAGSHPHLVNTAFVIANTVIAFFVTRFLKKVFNKKHPQQNEQAK